MQQQDASPPLAKGTAGVLPPPQSTRPACSAAATVPEQQLLYLRPADKRVETDRTCRQRVTPSLSAPDGSSCTYSYGQSSLTFHSSHSPGFSGCCFSQLDTRAFRLPSAEMLLVRSSESAFRYLHLLHSSLLGNTGPSGHTQGPTQSTSEQPDSIPVEEINGSYI